jgi:hypothetical protein
VEFIHIMSAPTTPDPMKARVIAQIRGEIGRQTGRQYQIDLDALDIDSLRELLRLLRDLDNEKTAAVKRAQSNPWGRP